MTIHAYRTEEFLYDYENDLLELKMDPEKCPTCISIVTNFGSENDLIICKKLTQIISDELKGVTRGARLCS